MLVWGVTWASAKVLSGYGSPISIAYLRFVVTVLTLFPAIKLLNLDIKIKKKGWLHVVVSGTLMALYSLIFFSGLQHGLAGSAGVLVTIFNPIFAFIIGLVISKMLPNKYESIGLFIGVIAGVVLLQVWKNTSDVFASGNLYFVLAALVWAVMSKITSRAGGFGHPICFTFWLQSVAVVGMSLIVDFSEVVTIVQQGDTKFWLNLMWFGMINSAVATSCFFYATVELGAEKASTFLFLVPLGAVFASWLFLNEPVMTHTLIGGVLGVLAVLVINKKNVQTK